MTELLTQAEAARICRVTTLTLSKWFEKKKLPRVKIGREWRYHPDVIDALAKGQYTNDPSSVEAEVVAPVRPTLVDDHSRVLHHRHGIYSVNGGTR